MSRCVLLILLAAAAIPTAAVTQEPGTGGGPAERRLMQLIEVVESGNSDRIRAFIRESYAPDVLRRNNEDRVVQWYMAMYNRSRGFEIDSVQATPTEAAALLRAELTGLWEHLSLRVEPTPPYRLLDFASFRLRPPTHPLADPAADDAVRVAEIDAIAGKLAEAKVFSGVVLLAKEDSVILLCAYGESDRERGLPMQPDTRFPLASITKTFVSVAIARLVEQGKISWDDPLGRFFPDFPLESARQSVRIRHLITHSSGVHDFTRYCERHPCPEMYRSMDHYVRVAYLAQADTLLYEPGTRYNYTNANFILLGMIIEQASHQPFYHFIRESVLTPAGMADTDLSDPGVVPTRMAVGYDTRYEGNGVRLVGRARDPEPYRGYPAPFAAANSTATDLLRFAVALRYGRILQPETVEVLFSAKPEAGPWGFGFEILDEERRLVGHSGSWLGQSNSLDLLTRAGYTAIILSNYTNGRTPLREAIWEILP